MLVDDLIRELKKHRIDYNINLRYNILEDGSIVDLGPLDVKIDVFQLTDYGAIYRGLDPDIVIETGMGELILSGFRDARS
jgi:hypothetical protein